MVVASGLAIASKLLDMNAENEADEILASLNFAIDEYIPELVHKVLNYNL